MEVGGTGAACYRKGFFGHDIRTEGREFNKDGQKNTIVWISARGFKTAGGGKLATTALKTAKSRDELFITELRQIVHNPETGKLKLIFDPLPTEDADNGPKKPFVIECDQLVYSLGQDDTDMKAMCKEFDADLELLVDETDMLLGVKSKDDRIHFFGAAAMAIRKQ